MNLEAKRNTDVLPVAMESIGNAGRVIAGSLIIMAIIVGINIISYITLAYPNSIQRDKLVFRSGLANFSISRSEYIKLDSSSKVAIRCEETGAFKASIVAKVFQRDSIGLTILVDTSLITRGWIEDNALRNVSITFAKENLTDVLLFKKIHDISVDPGSKR